MLLDLAQGKLSALTRLCISSLAVAEGSEPRENPIPRPTVFCVRHLPVLRVNRREACQEWQGIGGEGPTGPERPRRAQHIWGVSAELCAVACAVCHTLPWGCHGATATAAALQGSSSLGQLCHGAAGSWGHMAAAPAGTLLVPPLLRRVACAYGAAFPPLLCSGVFLFFCGHMKPIRPLE